VLARARQNPLRLAHLGFFFHAAQRHLRAIGPVDRVVAHFLVPCGFPMAEAVRGELEVVSHGSDVGLFAHMPRSLRTYVAGRLLVRGARFRFVSESLRIKLLCSLNETQRAAVSERSRVEPASIAVLRPCEADVERCRSILGGDGRPRWVTCARLIASKRVDRVIEEASRQGAQLTIIGDGPMRDALEKLAERHDPRPRFLGQLPRPEALAFIAAADKLVHLSEAEGAPTVVREARALGVPVLAMPSGDVAAWAENDAGIELARADAAS
jgi:glycosyltransferase involved in cell wall biosynthesis